MIYKSKWGGGLVISQIKNITLCITTHQSKKDKCTPGKPLYEKLIPTSAKGELMLDFLPFAVKDTILMKEKWLTPCPTESSLKIQIQQFI